ncbi:hypothetical protein [Erwinia phage FBB1]|nr:hypothetical protein [Erwinia phage FBB1]
MKFGIDWTHPFTYYWFGFIGFGLYMAIHQLFV